MSRRLVVEADGGSRGNPGPAGYGAVVRDADTGAVLAERAEAIGVATNNVAEYRGLIAGLRAAVDLEPAEVEVRMDSKLVVEQMSGRWQVKHPSMRPLAREAAGLLSQLPPVHFTWIPRERNTYADRLANEAMDLASTGQGWTPDAATEWLGQHEPVALTQLPAWMDPAAVATTTVLLRHGQTALSVDRRFSGSGGDPELTDLGRTQAEAAAKRLASSGAAVIVASPLRRAQQTAAAVSQALDLSVITDPDLRETDFGAWEGHTFTEVLEQWPAELSAWLANPAVAPPDGESVDATAARVVAARERITTSYAGQCVVLVSHVTPIKALVRDALGAPPAAMYRMHLDLASISEIAWYDGAAVVRSVNDISHLG